MMRVLKKDIYKGYTFLCHSYAENKIISSLHEKNVIMVKLKDGSFVELKQLINSSGRFKDVVRWIPHLFNRPQHSRELFVDERCLKPMFSNAEEKELIDIKDIESATEENYSL